MARILIQSDLGAMKLSEDLRPSNLADGDYTAKLVERLGWALSDAEASETVEPGSQIAWRDQSARGRGPTAGQFPPLGRLGD
jgi:hypothetical protein